MVHQTNGKMDACARQVVTHVYNKPEGKLEFAFVSCFCVNNVNTAVGQKYELGVRGPLNKKEAALPIL